MENEIQKLTFNMLPMTIGVLPSSYVDSMSYYETLIWLCNYLENTVIPAVNNNGEAVEELQSAYLTLHDYVEHYFDNLDVQEEINNKLDQMTEDGTLTDLISDYVDPIYRTYENEINNEISSFKTSVNSQIQNIDRLVTSSTSGSPKGVYNTVADLTAADPDHNYIYVVTADGKWYYYDTSLTSWNEGGVYQSSGIADNSISGIKTDFLNESLNVLKLEDKSGEVNGITYSISNGIITLDGTATTTFYLNANMKETQLFGPYRFKAFTDVVNSGIIISILSDDASPVYFSLQNINSSQINFVNNSNFTTFTMRIANGTVFDNLVFKPFICKEQYYSDDLPYSSYDEKLITDHIFDIGKKTISVENTNFIEKSINLVNPSNMVNGYVCRGESYGIPNYDASSSYKCYTIYNNSNSTKQYYIYPKYRLYLISSIRTTGVSTQPLDTLVETQTSEPSFISVPAGSRLIVTFFASDTDIMIAESSDPVTYTNYYLKINGLYDNVLNNKKLVTCGDSFTEYTNATFDSGQYYSKYKVWPYLIGLRNNMRVCNLAKSGSTMAVNNYSQYNFANDIYTQIPNDADYIIIKYGINDVNGETPIGTIDSSDDTTFYGAWNKVMSYIIEHYPLAKIGIIVTNGLLVQSDEPDNSNYAHAIIEIAKKYGIPTLNEWNDPNVPLLIRTGRTDVTQSIINLRNSTFRISADNTHENYSCHEYESTIIENFIRSL